MTPEEKLEKVEELLAARDEITAELLELMGATDGDEEVEEVEEQPKPKKKTKGKDKTIAKGTWAARAPRQPCDECGSAGTRHFKTCSKSTGKKSAVPASAQASSGRTIADDPVRLTETEYNDIRASVEDGLSVSSVAFSYPQVELMEVRKASQSETYQDYLS